MTRPRVWQDYAACKGWATNRFFYQFPVSELITLWCRKGRSIHQLARRVRVHRSAVYRWAAGTREPGAANLAALRREIQVRQVPPSIERLCGGCPVQPECLQHALTAPEEHGIWGGTTELQRQAMKRQRRRVTCPACSGRRLHLVPQQQVCLGCGTSWSATRAAPTSGHRRRTAA